MQPHLMRIVLYYLTRGWISLWVHNRRNTKISILQWSKQLEKGETNNKVCSNEG